MPETAPSGATAVPATAAAAQQTGTIRLGSGGARVARAARWLVTSAVVWHLAGCTPPPRHAEPVGAAYILQSVAGDSLPAVLFENELGRRMIIADTIWLNGRGSGARHAVIRWESSRPEEAASHQDDRAEFRYTVANGTIEIAFRCGGLFSLELCAAPPHAVGELTDDEVRLTYLVSARSPLVYRRRP